MLQEGGDASSPIWGKDLSEGIPQARNSDRKRQEGPMGISFHGGEGGPGELTERRVIGEKDHKETTFG